MWVRVPHLASHLLGRVARQIAADWQNCHGHPVHYLETFVEQSRFRGTAYQAANWLCLGQTTGRGKLDVHHQALLPQESGRDKAWREICPNTNLRGLRWAPQQGGAVANAYPFKVGHQYTRQDVFAILGIPKPNGGNWYTGYNAHGVTGNSEAFAPPTEPAGAGESAAGWRRRALSSSGA